MKDRTNELAVTGNRRELMRKTEQELNVIWDEIVAKNRAAGPWGVELPGLERWRAKDPA
jgi:hypothetical protein